MSKSKEAQKFGRAGGAAVKKSMGKDWFSILAALRWGKITKSQFRKLKAERQKKSK